MATIGNISKITIPVGQSNVTYWFADAWVREQIGLVGVGFTIAWDGDSVPVVANIPAGVTVRYNNTNYTGTLAANAAGSLQFYLVYSDSQIGDTDVYDEYVVIGTAGSKSWEKIGHTAYDFSQFKALAFKDAVNLQKGSGDTVLGSNAVLTARASNVTLKSGQTDTTNSVLGDGTTLAGVSSAVSFSGIEKAHALGDGAVLTASSSSIAWENDTPIKTSASVLGEHATFSTNMDEAVKYLKAEATGFGIVSAGSEATAVTGITPTTGTFVKDVTKSTSKLATTTISTVGGTDTASAVTKTAKKMGLVNVPHASSVGDADSWQFNYTQGTQTLAITGSNGGVPITLAASDDTVASGSLLASGVEGYATAGAEVIAAVGVSDKTVATKAATDTVVATGSLNVNDANGAEVVTDVTYAGNNQTGSALTALTATTTANGAVLTGVTAVNPTVSLSLEDTEATGRVGVLTNVSNATTTIASADAATAIKELNNAIAEGQSITITTTDTDDVITNLGTATAAAQTISKTADAVNAITALGNREAAAQAINISNVDSKTVAKYDDLSVSVS